jgi:hypothetical protein
MLHIVKFIQRHYPVAGNIIIVALRVTSVATLVAGLALMLLAK